jgi:hypothetical protein
MSGAARKGTGAVWAETARLREQFVKTTIEALPTRLAEASAELRTVRAKISTRDITVNELGIGALRALEFYMFYLVGRAVGGRSLTY